MPSIIRHFGKSLLSTWGFLFGGLLLAAVVWSYYMMSPGSLRIAVTTGPEAHVVGLLAQDSKLNRSLRLIPVEVPDFRNAGEAIEAGRAELAVIRPDVLFPKEAATVAIMREEALLIMAGEKLKEIGDIAAKRVGAVIRRPADRILIRAVLTHYDLLPPKTTVHELGPAALGGQSNKEPLDALMVLVTPGTEEAGELVETALRVLGAGAKILPLQGVGAFIKKSPGLHEVTIGAGALRGRPLLPKEELKTLAVSYRLVAATKVDRPAISALTVHLFQQRQSLAREQPNANFVKAPDDDRAMSAVLPNHRGAIDYYNREQVTFMDRYGDWLWLGLFAAGGLSSIFGWLVQTFVRRRREAIDDVLGRLPRILGDARECRSVEQLDALTLEVDDLVGQAVRQARRKTTSTHTMIALTMAIDSARHAIGDRRREIDLNGRRREFGGPRLVLQPAWERAGERALAP